MTQCKKRCKKDKKKKKLCQKTCCELGFPVVALTAIEDSDVRAGAIA